MLDLSSSEENNFNFKDMKLVLPMLILTFVVLDFLGYFAKAAFARPHRLPGLINRSVFTIVRFLNIPCTSPNGLVSGTCYSVHDCVRLHGTQIGTCASGYGVCCIFQRSCGAIATQNNTHFTNPLYPRDVTDPAEKTCKLTVLRSKKPPVCQIRLDFMDFQLAAPTEGECLTDKFVVSGGNVNAPIPVLCGTNTGQHLYIDVDNSAEPLHLAVTTKGEGSKRFNIKVTYIECDNPSRAPPNCLQYFTGERGRFMSFNYVPGEAAASGGYLNNQNYAICFRKNAGKCSQTYFVDGIESFLLLNLNPDTNSPTVGGGEAGLGVTECPMDYLIIAGDRYCGARLNPFPGMPNPTVNAPVTDSSAGPFIVYFKTDSANNAIGFDVQYVQNPC